MNEAEEIRQAVAQLIENLGATGVIMLNEVRDSMEQSFNVSRAQFKANVDRVANSLKESGRMATEDVDRAAEQIKQNWEVLHKANMNDWEQFLDELGKRLDAIGSLSRESFELAVEQSKKIVERQWEATGKLGENQLRQVQERTEAMAKRFKDNWDFFSQRLNRTEGKFSRAVRAAWDELEK